MNDKDGQNQNTPDEKDVGQGDDDSQNVNDNPDGGNQGDPEKDNQPDEPKDGLTDAEREQMTKLEESYLNAQQKISADGDEKAELRRQLQEKDATIAALSRGGNNQSEGATAPGTEDDPYAGIDLEKLRQESPEAFAVLERQHQLWEQTRADMAKSQQQQKDSTQKETQFEQYQSQYGLSRQQFEAIWAARAQGNHFDADSLLNSYSKVNTAKREQQEQQQADRSKVVNGNSQSQPSQIQNETDVQAEITRLKGLKGEELENAIVGLYGKLPESQVNAIVNSALLTE